MDSLHRTTIGCSNVLTCTNKKLHDQQHNIVEHEAFCNSIIYG